MDCIKKSFKDLEISLIGEPELNTGPVEEKDWLRAQMRCEMDGELPPKLREDEIHTR